MKSAHIVGFCCKSSGFTDFENTVDRGFRIVLVLMFSSWVPNEIWISLGRYVNEFIQISGIVMFYSHEACFFLYYLHKITSNNEIHIYISRFSCGFGFEQNYRQFDGFGKIRP